MATKNQNQKNFNSKSKIYSESKINIYHSLYIYRNYIKENYMSIYIMTIHILMRIILLILLSLKKNSKIIAKYSSHLLSGNIHLMWIPLNLILLYSIKLISLFKITLIKLLTLNNQVNLSNTISYLVSPLPM